MACFCPADGGRWNIHCTVDEQPRPPKLKVPLITQPEQLLSWILPTRTNNGEDLAAETCRLRIRAEDLGPPEGQLPPILCWPMLLDHDRANVLDHGWTLLHMTAEPVPERGRWKLSGDVAVLCDPAIAASLREEGLANIYDVSDARSVPMGSVAVVPGIYDTLEVVELQRAFFDRRCPLVVWCGAVIPPVGEGLLEAIPTGECHPENERTSAWLGRLIRRMRAGEEPEDALARALRDGPDGSLLAWLLRGTLRPLEHPDDTREWREKFRHWRHELDREEQSSRLKTHAEHLLTAPTRRVQVVLVAAERKAGIQYFRGRNVEPQVPGVSWQQTLKTPPWKPIGAPGAPHALDTLLDHFKADNPVELASKLRRLAPSGTLAFVRINHPELPLGDGEGDTVTAEDLRRYILSLRALASELAPSVRVLVCLYVVTPSPERFSIGAFAGDDALPATMSVNTLKPILDKVPEEEIDIFLDGRQIETDPVARQSLVLKLAAMDYDAMIETLNARYSAKLR